MSANLLIELLTEELPPKALKQLADACAQGIAAGLASRGLVSVDAAREIYATPRRLAVKIDGVASRGEDRRETKKLMPAKVAFGADGKASMALRKRLEKEGVPADADVDALIERKMEGKEEFVFHTQVLAGQALPAALQAALESAIEKLPIPKVMSYQLADGATTVHFVRPAHGLIALHGNAVVPVGILGLTAGRVTQGHRFQGARDIEIATADAYEEALAAHGMIIASFEQRRADIYAQLQKRAAELGATLGAAADYEPLLDEVNALVEMPTVYVGTFEAEFLTVPQECLVLTMRANQKYFPLFDSSGKLTNRFLIVSNMRLEEPKNIIEGNQRVIRPRLSDARFFFETDKKVRLDARVPELARIVYHNKLGSQLERSTRVQTLAGIIARAIGADAAAAERAAWLAKADLLTNMVGEFPELQGTMGRYYALADGESSSIATAIGNQAAVVVDAGIGSGAAGKQATHVDDRALPKEDAVGVDEVDLTVGVQAAQNLAGVGVQNAVHRHGACRWLHEVDRLGLADVEAVPVERQIRGGLLDGGDRATLTNHTSATGNLTADRGGRSQACRQG